MDQTRSLTNSLTMAPNRGSVLGEMAAKMATKKNQILSKIRSHADEIRMRFRVRSLYVFGSVARDEATVGSDIDLLVEFEGAADFDSFMGLKIYLEDLLGDNIDLVTSKAVRKEMRETIQNEALHVA